MTDSVSQGVIGQLVLYIWFWVRFDRGMYQENYQFIFDYQIWWDIGYKIVFLGFSRFLQYLLIGLFSFLLHFSVIRLFLLLLLVRMEKEFYVLLILCKNQLFVSIIPCFVHFFILLISTINLNISLCMLLWGDIIYLARVFRCTVKL